MAIALAALGTSSVMDQLENCKNNGIPVIGFDSGVPNALVGAIYANASTDNFAAAGLAAAKMFNAIKDDFNKVSSFKPIKIVVLNQDATGESILSRGKGFRDKMIDEIIAGTSTDAAASATNALNKVKEDNILGMFCTNEATVKGLLAATNDGADLGSKHKGLIVMGFDAGKGQKDAVRAGYFMGSITQDPYSIGFKAIELAYNAYMGKPVSDVDTGAKYYDASNMDDADISGLLYD